MNKGHDCQLIGNEGEHLFGVLAARWGAIWTNTREAAAVDGWLSWPDLPGITLWVQVKSRRELGTKGTELRIRIPNADTLADWSAREPILVVPVFDEKEAFWIDTADQLPKPPPMSFTFRIPLSNAVSRTSKATIRQIARRRILRESMAKERRRVRLVWHLECSAGLHNHFRRRIVGSDSPHPFQPIP